VRKRLIVAFIVVTLLAALTSHWVINLALPVFPSLARRLAGSGGGHSRMLQ
jgi:hypothetical protein